MGLRQKTNREKPQPQSLLGIYFEKPKIAETQIDQGKSLSPTKQRKNARIIDDTQFPWLRSNYLNL